MSNILKSILVFLLGVGFTLLLLKLPNLLRNKPVEFSKKSIIKDKPFEKYSIESLSKKDIKPGKITIKSIIKEENAFISYLFEFEFNPNLDGKTLKRTTGQINIPKTSDRSLQAQKFPIVLMLRGYIDQKAFKTGDGTKNAAAYFANNGFITMAPDFLGYGGSDPESGNIFESRFQTYVTALTLLKTLEQIENDPKLLDSQNYQTNDLLNYSLIFLWGHSNGGQVALTILEVGKATYPTVLWAPVSKPFPYSILYYTDDSDDHGKLIRNELSKFEADHDAEKYSPTNYLDSIKAPILLQHGSADAVVPRMWSDNLFKILTTLDLEIEYKIYQGADHNMRPLWDDVVAKDLEYFRSNL